MSTKFDTTVATQITKQHDEMRRLDSKALLARASEIGTTLSHGGVQRSMAMLAFSAAQLAKRGKAETFDVKPYLNAFAERYYDGSAPQRMPLTDGSRKTLTSTYEAFAAAGMLPYNATPVVVKVLSALNMGMPARAKTLREIVKASPDKCPTDKALTAAMAGQGNQSATVSPVARAKAVLSSATNAGEDAAFLAALKKTPKATKLFALIGKSCAELVNMLDVKTDKKSTEARNERAVFLAKMEKLEGARVN